MQPYPSFQAQQLAVLNAAYREAVARKRLQACVGGGGFSSQRLIVAALGAEVKLRTLFTYFGNFVSYFDRILTLEDGTRVWTNPAEWFWGWQQMAVDVGRDHSDQLCRHPDRSGPCLCAEFLCRAKHLARAMAAVRRSPLVGICPHRSRHRVGA